VLQITAERFLASFLPPATGLGDRHGDADVVFKATAVALAPSHGYHRSREAESLVLVEDTVARLLERVVAMGNAKYSEAKRKTQAKATSFRRFARTAEQAIDKGRVEKSEQAVSDPAKANESRKTVDPAKAKVEDYVFDTKESILLDPGDHGDLLIKGLKLALPIVPAVTADDATADLNHEVVEQLVVLFQDRVSQALALEERIHPAALHAWLREGTIVYLHEKPKVESKATKPPARFTKASLLKAMETCYNLVSKDLREAMKGGIGTAATRADIIDKLCLQKWL
ncbi:topB, partial [Symbiodinium sp. KB8]